MSSQVHNIGTEHLHKTWFLVKGQIGAIDLRTWEITEVMMLAKRIGATHFWRRLSQNMDDLSYNWGCYRVTTPAPAKIEPFKVVRSPDSYQAEMICRTLQGAGV